MQPDAVTQVPFEQTWLLVQQVWVVPVPHMFEAAQQTPPMHVCEVPQQASDAPVPQVELLTQHTPFTQVDFELQLRLAQLPTHAPLTQLWPEAQHDEPQTLAVLQQVLLTQLWPLAQITPPHTASQV